MAEQDEIASLNLRLAFPRRLIGRYGRVLEPWSEGIIETLNSIEEYGFEQKSILGHIIDFLNTQLSNMPPQQKKTKIKYGTHNIVDVSPQGIETLLLYNRLGINPGVARDFYFF